MKTASQCHFCKHLDVPPNGPDWTCEAFPGGIPGEILSNERSHDTAYPGDGGVTWEARSDNDAVAWEWLQSKCAREGSEGSTDGGGEDGPPAPDGASV